MNRYWTLLLQHILNYTSLSDFTYVIQILCVLLQFRYRIFHLWIHRYMEYSIYLIYGQYVFVTILLQNTKAFSYRLYLLRDASVSWLSIPRKLRTCCFVANKRSIFCIYSSNAARRCSNTFGCEFLTRFGGNGAISELSFFNYK